MTIKNTLTLLFVAFLSFTGSAQDYKANIKQRFGEYTRLIVGGDYKKSMDYLPDVIFTLVPKAQMITFFEQTMQNKEVEVKITGFDIKEITDSRKIDTSYYAKIKYISGMTMKMASDKVESPDEKANRLHLLKEAFANTFGSDNVKLDEATEIFTITPLKTSWAISKNGQTDWKFINIEPKQHLIMEKILPKVLIEESLN